MKRLISLLLCLSLLLTSGIGLAAVNPSSLGGPKPQYVDSTGLPASGYKVFFYVAGSVNTKQNTYTDATGLSANTNPVLLNSLGEPPSGIFFTAGQSYKAVFALPTDTDPPSSPLWTIDNIKGINDTTVTQSQWVAGPAPTFVSATSFTLAGDQTSTFTVGLRLQITDAINTKYATVTVSSYDGISLTTITTVNDGGLSLVSPLAAVSYGLLSPTSISIPRFIQAGTNITVTYDSSGRPVINNSYTNPYIVPRAYLAGLTLSNASTSSGSMVIAAGMATDSTNTTLMALPSAYTKTTAAWTLGTGVGGLDTGSVSVNTWYHWYEIERVDTGVVDCIFSLSASAPTLPANYTIYRRIGSGFVDTTLHWVNFTQDGDLFELSVPVLETTSATPGTSAVTLTLANVPTGVNVRAILNNGTQATQLVYFSDLATTDAAPSATAAPLGTGGTTGTGSNFSYNQVTVRTNTSAQVRYRTNNNSQIYVTTVGWLDQRGKAN